MGGVGWEGVESGSRGIVGILRYEQHPWGQRSEGWEYDQEDHDPPYLLVWNTTVSSDNGLIHV